MEQRPLTPQEKSSQRRIEAALSPEADTRRPIEGVTFLDGRDDAGNHEGTILVTLRVNVSTDMPTLLAYDFDAYVQTLDDNGLDYAIADYKALIHRLIAEKYTRKCPRSDDDLKL